MQSAIDHPPHYNKHPSGVEAVDVCEHLSFNLGNALKYVWRAGLKDDTKRVEDLEKARWYLRRELDRFACFYDDDGVSAYDREHWKPFARKVVRVGATNGLLERFCTELLRVEVPDSRRSLNVLLGVVEMALKEAR